MRGWWATARGHVISIRHFTLSVETVAGEMRRLPWSAGSRDTYMASVVRANSASPPSRSAGLYIFVLCEVGGSLRLITPEPAARAAGRGRYLRGPYIGVIHRITVVRVLGHVLSTAKDLAS